MNDERAPERPSVTSDEAMESAERLLQILMMHIAKVTSPSDPMAYVNACRAGLAKHLTTAPITEEHQQHVLDHHDWMWAMTEHMLHRSMNRPK